MKYCRDCRYRQYHAEMHPPMVSQHVAEIDVCFHDALRSPVTGGSRKTEDARQICGIETPKYFEAKEPRQS